MKTVKNWNPALFGIRNPLYWNPESSTRNPESTAWNPESKNVLDSLTWGETVIKKSILLVSEPLTHIINLSIQHGIVRDEMKIARVLPIFKSDDQSLFTNYRPLRNGACRSVSPAKSRVP